MTSKDWITLSIELQTLGVYLNFVTRVTKNWPY